MKPEGFTQVFGQRTLIMGILNVTPDSFYDAGRYASPDLAARRAVEMVEQGADIIDVGGESTRPGSSPVDAQEERRRVVPVVREIARRLPVLVSVDTYKAGVAEAALGEGAHLVNDIFALRGDPRMTEVVSRFGAGVVLMHMQGTPATMQQNPQYDDVILEIQSFLEDRVQAAREGGVPPGRIIVDPGIGFGKTVAHNLEILRRLRELKRLGQPLLVGPSRKSFLGALSGLPAEERLEGTAAALALAVAQGADIVRVHDVKEMKRVAVVADAVVRSSGEA
ncbi:MAG: dihydropteroate synthase [Firmicutes bacterium]|nr:dihydropteroate synthase [Bacillota bacterium]